MPSNWKANVLVELDALIGSLEFIKNHIDQINPYATLPEWREAFDKRLVKAVRKVDKLEVISTRL